MYSNRICTFLTSDSLFVLDFFFFPQKHKDPLKNMSACKFKKAILWLHCGTPFKKMYSFPLWGANLPLEVHLGFPNNSKAVKYHSTLSKNRPLFGESLYARLHLRTDDDRWVKGTASGDTDRPLARDTQVVLLCCQVYQTHGAEHPSCSVLHNGWVCSEVSVLQSDIYTKIK